MIDGVLENFRDQIEALTPDDEPDVEFKRYSGPIEKASKTAGSDRRFAVLPDEGIEVMSPASPQTRVRFKKVVLVMVQYRVGPSLERFIERAHKDVDRMTYTLRRPDSYGSGADWKLLGRQPLERFYVDVDDAAKSALVTVAFETIYSVDYA